jgi:hypothetical protein
MSNATPGSNRPGTSGFDDPLSVEGRDYLAAAASAAARTRNVTITLIALSVVMFVGMLNSLEHSWAGARILIASNADHKYVTGNNGRAPAPEQFRDDAVFDRARLAYEERYRQFYSALMRSYVETGFAVMVWLGLMFPLTAWVVIQMIEIDRTWSDWADLRFGFSAVQWPPETKLRSRWAVVPASMKIHDAGLNALPPRSA